MRLGRLARLAAGGVAALLVSGACGGGGDGSDRTDTVAAAPAPHVPAHIAPGCGAQAMTAPADLDAGRAVARCGAGAPEARPLPTATTLRVAVPESYGSELAPVLLAEALGEFEAENLRVELAPLGPREGMAALEAGRVDIVAGPLDAPYFDAVHDGSGARLVLGGALSPAPDATSVGQTGLWVRADALDDEGGLSDLQLQAVGVPGGTRSAATYPIGRALGQTEISLNEVAVTDMPSGEAAGALRSGDIAAAWLDGGTWLPVAGQEGFLLAATLPASEAIDGTIASARLLGTDRPVGVAYARAVIRTVNTYLTGDYRTDDEVVEALAGALDLAPAVLREAPPVLFDWEVREGTLGRIEDALLALGGVTYDLPLDDALLVDRSLAREAIGVGAGPDDGADASLLPARG
jgi:NitT/TauT family transport system substrate-binding protein